MSFRLLYIPVVLFFAFLQCAQAGLIIQRPNYTGLNNGLVGFWSFDEKDMAGVKSYDRSGQGNDGTLTNGPVRTFGKIGQALSFDGSSAYVSAGNVTSNLKSISFWVKPDSTTDQIIGLGGSGALGGFVSVGTLGTANDTTADTSFTLTPSATLNSGNIGILIIAKDNEGTTDTSNDECDEPTDSVGNTYTKLREYTNGNGAADAGATVCVFFTKATTDLTTAGTVTMTVTTNSVKAATFWEFTIGAGNTIQIAGTPGDLAEDSVQNAGLIAISGLDSKEYLFVRGTAIEYNQTGTSIPTASHTEITEVTANTGTIDTSMLATGEFRILTNTADTSNPTGDTGNRDYSSTFLALEEVAGGSTIDISGGTLSANNFTSPTIYVDGVVSSTLRAGSWHHVVIKTDTVVTADSVDIGRISGTGNFNGFIDDVRIYNRALSADEIKRLYNLGR